MPNKNTISAFRCGPGSVTCECKCGYTCDRKCGLDLFKCINEHFKRDCGHIWDREVEFENGSSVACKCGMTAMDHDCWVGP